MICLGARDREPSDKSKSGDKSPHSKFGVLRLGGALGVAVFAYRMTLLSVTTRFDRETLDLLCCSGSRTVR